MVTERTRNSRKNTIPPSRSSSPRSYAKPGTRFGAGTSSAVSSVTRQRNLNILKLVSNRNSRRYAEDIQGTVVLIGQSVLGEDQNKICSDRNPQNCKNMSCSIDNLEGSHTKQKLDYAMHRRFSETIEFRTSTKHQRERSQGQSLSDTRDTLIASGTNGQMQIDELFCAGNDLVIAGISCCSKQKRDEPKHPAKGLRRPKIVDPRKKLSKRPSMDGR